MPSAVILSFPDVVARCLAAFPQYPPYGGEFDEFVPHLTLR